MLVDWHRYRAGTTRARGTYIDSEVVLQSSWAAIPLRLARN